MGIVEITSQQAASLGGWRDDQVRDAAHAGIFTKARKVGSRWYFDRAEVERWATHPELLLSALRSASDGVKLDFTVYLEASLVALSAQSGAAPITSLEQERDRRGEAVRDTSQFEQTLADLQPWTEAGWNMPVVLRGYPDGHSDRSATPGEAAGQLIFQALELLSPSQDLRRLLRQEYRGTRVFYTGLNPDTGEVELYRQLRKDWSSQQGLTSLQQAGDAIIKIGSSLNEQWRSWKQGRKQA